MVEIPKGTCDSDGPCWIPVVDTSDQRLKPLIKCKCGAITGIGLHYVHADGRVTASYYHKRGDKYPEDPNGCEWHVHLKLLDYDWGEYPPEKIKQKINVI